MMKKQFFFIICVILSLALNLPVFGQPAQTSPEDFFGYPVGTDYQLFTYSQFGAYWQKLAGETDRMQVIEIGRTEEDRPQYMAIITAPENFANLDKFKTISRKMALDENVDDAAAKSLAKSGKPVVWIDGGLHATEVVGSHQLIEMAWELTHKNDEETQRFLQDLIILLVHANPDGMELVSSWYMREKNEKKRRFDNLPRLYQKYIGHDNNRDHYMVTQKETENLARIH